MFEFDPAKSAANKAKHGIDFEEAQALWDDTTLLEIVSAQRHVGEERQLAIGRTLDRVWTAIVTRRSDAIRIISVRRARVIMRRWRMNKPGKVVPEANAPERISAEELDRRFNEGEDVSAYFDWSSARQPNLEAKRVNVDFPAWMVHSLDREAKLRGVSRQALIKMWLADRLEATG